MADYIFIRWQKFDVFASAVVGTLTFLLCIAPHHLSTVRLGFFKPGVPPEVIRFIFQSSIVCT